MCEARSARDDRECVCEARSAKDRYCLRWNCVQKSNGEIDTEEYYECAADDSSGEYCLEWQGNISSSYQISSAVCRCVEAQKNYCTEWACDERWLVRCGSHSGGWCDMGIALGVGGAFGGFTAIWAVVIVFSEAADSRNCDFAPLIIAPCVFCFTAGLWLIGVVIWGGVMGVVWTSVMWTIILSIPVILYCVGVCFYL